MTSSNKQSNLLQEGIARAQAGDKSAARALFEQLAASRPDHETVWLWLSSVAPDATSCAGYLEKALEVDPGNQQARQWLDRLRPPAERQAFYCPFCSQSFTAQPAQCARCHADFDLSNLEIFFRPASPELDEDLLQEAMERLHQQEEGSELDRHRLLTLGYLNLRQPEQAIEQLRLLAEKSPESTHLGTAVETLNRLIMENPRRERLRRSEAQTAEIDPALLMKEVSSATARRPTVLVVDDSPTVRTVVSQTLEQQGYRTVMAGDGMEALARLQDVVPDLVLLDVTMPHLDGFKICRVIKDSSLTSHVPVVFLSAKDGFLDKVRGRMAGAADYLAKPVSKNNLLKVVERYCDRGVVEKQ